MTTNTDTTPDDLIPVAAPLGSPAPSASDEASANSDALAAPNTDTSSVPSSPGRVGGRALAKLRHDLTERDWRILRLVGDHRYLTTRQIEGFCFANLGSPESAERTARRVLARLAHEGVLRTLARRIGGVRAGSGATVYYLAPAGARLLAGDTGRHFRSREPSERFLLHCLAIGEAHLELNSLAVRDDVTSIEVALEPACWRTYTGPGGESRSLQPDLAVTIQGADYEDRWFLEVDMGTESIPTLLTKSAQYDTYRRTGAEQASHEVFPMVCWLMLGAKAESRAEQLRQRLRAKGYPDGMFHVCTEDQLSLTLTGAVA